MVDESNKWLNMSMSSMKTTPKSIDMTSSNYQRLAKNGGNLMDKLNMSTTETVTIDIELCALLFRLMSNFFVTIFNFSNIRLSSTKLLLYHYVIRFYSYFMDGNVNNINNTTKQLQSTMEKVNKKSHTNQLKHFNYWYLLPLTVTTVAYGWILLLWFINKIFLIKVPAKLFYKAR